MSVYLKKKWEGKGKWGTVLSYFISSQSLFENTNIFTLGLSREGFILYYSFGKQINESMRGNFFVEFRLILLTDLIS